MTMPVLGATTVAMRTGLLKHEAAAQKHEVSIETISTNAAWAVLETEKQHGPAALHCSYDTPVRYENNALHPAHHESLCLIMYHQQSPRTVFLPPTLVLGP